MKMVVGEKPRKNRRKKNKQRTEKQRIAMMESG
jgi:hypothetical protein